ncbi:hypothetical protein L6278_00490 [Candidatus Parcubacteria bacterium]|nr:hypothetical protein [Candidatus Parcubacteria bacterium]
MKKQIWIPILVVVIIIVGIILLTQNKNNQIDENQEPIKIGAILPLTGKIAQYAEEARRGIEIAS